MRTKNKKKAAPRKYLLPHKNKRIFPLLNLPRELRDPIYMYVIAGGDVQILRTCKQINDEASPLVPKHGVLRVHLGWRHCTQWSQLGKASVFHIRHLDLRLNMITSAPRCQFKLVSGFFDKNVKRGSCVVTIDVGDIEAHGFHMGNFDSFKQLAQLAGFRETHVRMLSESLGKAGCSEIELFAVECYLPNILPYEFKCYMEYY